jgi:hypothetical protein
VKKQSRGRTHPFIPPKPRVGQNVQTPQRMGALRAESSQRLSGRDDRDFSWETLRRSGERDAGSEIL